MITIQKPEGNLIGIRPIKISLLIGLEKRMDKGADISICGTYRYHLWRRWAPVGRVTWIMLNPSTADAEHDDATIRRCIGYAKQWGAGGIEVINLYALRSPSPKVLLKHEDPIGPVNNLMFQSVLNIAKNRPSVVIAAWGALRAPFRQRALDIVAMCDEIGISLLCLGHTKAGYPRHPLYVKLEQKRVRWSRTVTTKKNR